MQSVRREMATRSDPDYGIGSYEMGDDIVATGRAAAELTLRLRDHFSSPDYTPPLLPGIALEIHELAKQPDVDIGQVVGVMEKDPMLAARVLKIAQSAAFASAGNIHSLRDAVVRIGLRNLREIVWEVALHMRVFRSQRYGGPMEQVRVHSISCAHLARAVSAFTAIATDYAFLCGLLHDVGMAAAIAVLGEDKVRHTPPDEAVLGQVLRACHPTASQVVASAWKLPMDVQLVVGHHHAVLVSGHVHPLTAVVAVADELACEGGRGVVLGEERADRTDPATLERARSALQLDDRRMGLLRRDVQKLIPAVDERARTPAPIVR